MKRHKREETMNELDHAMRNSRTRFERNRGYRRKFRLNGVHVGSDTSTTDHIVQMISTLTSFMLYIRLLRQLRDRRMLPRATQWYYSMIVTAIGGSCGY